jgi:hypothetical protein
VEHLLDVDKLTKSYDIDLSKKVNHKHLSTFIRGEFGYDDLEVEYELFGSKIRLIVYFGILKTGQQVYEIIDID